MNPGQADPREHLQRTIDAEIKSLEEFVRALKHRRNALSPVSSLPSEVFAAIFSLLCIPGTLSLDGKPVYHLERVRVSHVCHQWREIALNQPLLWSHVDFTTLSLAGIAETLVRAKSVPLHLEASVSRHCGWDNVRSSTFRKELRAHLPHIRYLRTSAKPDHLQSTLNGLISPASTLEYLSLSSRVGRRNRRSGGQVLCIPDTLFDGSAPRLSCLELRNCNISWKSPLLRGLKCLEIHTPSADTWPKLALWLGALDEMPQLKTLTLHSASPSAPPFPIKVERTVTLPFLTRLDILASPRDCALALAHLDLPALTSLRLTAFSIHLANTGEVEKLLPYIIRHVHGPQDTQPLQGVFCRTEADHIDVLAWPVPDIDVVVHNPPTLLAATLPTRVALAFRSEDWLSPEERIEILNMVMAVLPLDDLVTLAAHVGGSPHDGDAPTQPFWNYLSPKSSLLRRVRLGPWAVPGFIDMLLEDNGGREGPVLPSLKELVVVYPSLFALSFHPLCDALTRRAEQGVPVEILDLRMCSAYEEERSDDWLRSLSEIVVDVLGPEKSFDFDSRDQMKSMWDKIARGPFVDGDNSREDNHSYSVSDDTGSDDGRG